MTLDLITLAREAMVLEGAPDAPCMLAPSHGSEHTAIRAIGTTDVWNLAATTPAAWALGGVLLGALGHHRARVVTGYDGSVWWFDGDVKDAHSSTHVHRWTHCKTLAEACCRVAMSLGRWPGGGE